MTTLKKRLLAWCPLKANEWGLMAAIVVVVALTTLLDEQHNYWSNPKDSAIQVLRQTTLLGIFALGAAVVIIAGGIDLSSGSMIAFSGTVCATFLLLLDPQGMTSGELSPAVITAAILGTMVVGFLIGSLHAWLITVVGLPPFIATLATLVGLRSFARWMIEAITLQVSGMRSSQIWIYSDRFCYLASSVWVPAVIFFVLAVAAWILMARTTLGRHLYALGGNEDAARLSGIRTDRLKWLAYCIGAMLSTIAGILYVAETGTADPQTLGRAYELNAIAAAVVGGCSLNGGIGTIPGTILGCVFLRTVIDGVAKIIKGGADTYEGMIVGVVVVLAVAVNQMRRAGVRRTRFFPGALGAVAVAALALLAGTAAALQYGKEPGGAVALAALVALALVKVFEDVRAKRARLQTGNPG